MATREIIMYLRINRGQTTIVDKNNKPITSPALYPACYIDEQINLKIRPLKTGGTAYATTDFATIVSWDWGFTQDFSTGTDPLMRTQSGVTVTEVTEDGATYAQINITADANTSELETILSTYQNTEVTELASNNFGMELLGYESGSSNPDLVYQAPFVAINRRLRNGAAPGTAGVDYLTPAQLLASYARRDFDDNYSELEEAIADDDQILSNNTSDSGAIVYTTFARVKTWLLAAVAAITDLTSYSWFLDEDDMASDSATKAASQQSIKAYVDGEIDGLGDMATQDADSVAITGGSVSGITDLAVADGGTGASDAATARTNLGLGTIATQNANSVAITGGTGDITLGDTNAATLKKMAMAASTELTISGGAVIATQMYHSIDGESDSDDDLETITYSGGNLLVIYPENSGRTITLIDSAGNIVTGSGKDYEIPANGLVILAYDGANWRIVGGSGETTAYTTTFVDADLEIDESLTVTHGLNSQVVIAAFSDDNDEQVIPDITYTDADNLSADFSNLTPLSGTYTVIVVKGGGSGSGDGGGGSAPVNQEIYLDTANGHGSTNTKIRRFTNVRVNSGSDMTLTQSATLGDYVTINTTGIYAISYSDNFNADSRACGITVNSSELTTPVDGLSDITKRVAFGADRSNTDGECYPFCSTVINLTASDVVRPHTQGDSAHTADRSNFRITRIG